PDTDQIRLSDDAIEPYLGPYQTLRAARQQDPAQLAEVYRDLESLVLTLDGLQPEKGHATLDVVRELMRKRVWFAEPWLSRAPQGGRGLVGGAGRGAGRGGKPGGVWMADKPEPFVPASADEFGGPPPRSGQNHFLGDVAPPVLAMDSR